MSTTLVLDDASVTVSITNGAGSATVTLRNSGDSLQTPYALGTAPMPKNPVPITIKGGGKHCGVTVPETAVPKQSTQQITIAFAGCKETKKAKLVVGTAEHPMTFTKPDRITAAEISLPLAIGAAFGIAFVAWAGIKMVRGVDRDRNVLIDPNDIFSLKDGWLTNITGLSAALVAVFGATTFADTLLAKTDQLSLALLGLVVLALLALAPIVLILSTDAFLAKLDGDTKPTTHIQTAVWGYALASAVTSAAAIAQLAGFGYAVSNAAVPSELKWGAWVTLAALAVVALSYGRHYFMTTLALSGARYRAPAEAAGQRIEYVQPAGATAPVPVPWSLSL
jgi:hypothetical protein